MRDKNRRIQPARGRIARSQHGVMLLEALFAILIFSMGILALIGFQATAVKQVADAKYRADASFLANRVVGEMWVNRANLAAYTYSGGTPPTVLSGWVGAVQASLPGVTNTDNPPVIAVAGNQITVTITWEVPGSLSPNRYVMVANIHDA